MVQILPLHEVSKLDPILVRLLFCIICVETTGMKKNMKRNEHIDKSLFCIKLTVFGIYIIYEVKLNITP